MQIIEEFSSKGDAPSMYCIPCVPGLQLRKMSAIDQHLPAICKQIAAAVQSTELLLTIVTSQDPAAGMPAEA